MSHSHNHTSISLDIEPYKLCPENFWSIKTINPIQSILSMITIFVLHYCLSIFIEWEIF